MKSLIARLERATGPDRELDCYLWASVNGNGQDIIRVGPPTYDPVRFFCNPNPEISWLGYDLLNVAPVYTASLDSALTLVPEGWRVGSAVEEPDGRWYISLSDKAIRNHAARANAASLCIALCIAALKARL